MRGFIDNWRDDYNHHRSRSAPWILDIQPFTIQTLIDQARCGQYRNLGVHRHLDGLLEHLLVYLQHVVGQ